MRKPVSICAFLSTVLAASPLLALAPDETQTMRENIAQQQRMMDLHQQINDRMQRHMQLLLAEGPGGGPMTVGQLPDGQPVIVDEPNGGLIVRRAPRMEKAAFLGISASPVSGVLRDQLKLPRGACLVVDFVAKDSPAETAGVQVHDILEKLDDQLLVNSEQLLVLVRNKKPGDEITLTLLHEGQTVAVPAKLTERDLPMLEDMDLTSTTPTATPESVDVNPAPGVYQNWQHGKRTSIMANPDGTMTRTYVDGDSRITLKTDKAGADTLVVLDQNGQEIFNGPCTADELAKLPADVAAKVQDLQRLEVKVVHPMLTQSMSLSRTDDTHAITITINETGRHCVVKEVATGKVVFDGPIDTDEQIAAMDAAVADKVRKLLEKVGK